VRNLNITIQKFVKNFCLVKIQKKDFSDIQMNFETMRLDGSGEQKQKLVVIRKSSVVYYKRLTTN